MKSNGYVLLCVLAFIFSIGFGIAAVVYYIFEEPWATVINLLLSCGFAIVCHAFSKKF